MQGDASAGRNKCCGVGDSRQVPLKEGHFHGSTGQVPAAVTCKWERHRAWRETKQEAMDTIQKL